MLAVYAIILLNWPSQSEWKRTFDRRGVWEINLSFSFPGSIFFPIRAWVRIVLHTFLERYWVKQTFLLLFLPRSLACKWKNANGFCKFVIIVPECICVFFPKLRTKSEYVSNSRNFLKQILLFDRKMTDPERRNLFPTRYQGKRDQETKIFLWDKNTSRSHFRFFVQFLRNWFYYDQLGKKLGKLMLFYLCWVMTGNLAAHRKKRKRGDGNRPSGPLHGSSLLPTYVPPSFRRSCVRVWHNNTSASFSKKNWHDFFLIEHKTSGWNCTHLSPFS